MANRIYLFANQRKHALFNCRLVFPSHTYTNPINDRNAEHILDTTRTHHCQSERRKLLLIPSQTNGRAYNRFSFVLLITFYTDANFINNENNNYKGIQQLYNITIKLVLQFPIKVFVCIYVIVLISFIFFCARPCIWYYFSRTLL